MEGRASRADDAKAWADSMETKGVAMATEEKDVGVLPAHEVAMLALLATPEGAEVTPAVEPADTIDKSWVAGAVDEYLAKEPDLAGVLRGQLAKLVSLRPEWSRTPREKRNEQAARRDPDRIVALYYDGAQERAVEVHVDRASRRVLHHAYGDYRPPILLVGDPHLCDRNLDRLEGRDSYPFFIAVHRAHAPGALSKLAHFEGPRARIDDP
jgi:hypothetical protein